MEDQRSETDKLVDEVILPGFRFHPTDEELVGFYLKRKIQHRPLSIELIKQLDIYKYDPWDLPKLASTGEKEWYFYCPRDRKYRNSARPNRVTGAGFWKATGTDRPIYSSEGTKCIGLKKSLVFYKGRAAKGVKTDWMMHEFRLPSIAADHSTPTSKRLDKSFPANDSWAICRIFKKASSTAQRALSHSWVSPFSPESTNTILANNQGTNSSETISNMSIMSTTRTASQFSNPNNENNRNPQVDFVSYKPYQISCTDIFPSLLYSPLESSSNMPPIINKASSHHDGMDLIGAMISQDERFCGDIPFSYNDNHAFQGTSSIESSIDFEHQNSMMIRKYMSMNETTISDDQDQWESVQSSLGFPFGANFHLPSLPLSTAVAEPWKPSLLWDTLPCPTEASTNFPSTRCFN